ncbi:hypothetical protein [Nonomuraea recticatena]|uniref:Uncharacterized protein n=1 Tax=Nonomuraea recticatena TaxID=46178 RepID=A0ABP6FK57_9ACTN
MDWMLLNTICSIYLGVPYVPQAPAAWVGTGPTETDLWITRLTYEVVADGSACDKCQAPFGRRLRLTESRNGSGAWWITVAARCRGWRRHRFTALVTEWGDGLRFGEWV